MIVRLDKYLANLGLITRKNVGKTVKSGEILLNGKKVEKSDIKIKEGDIVTFFGKDIEVKEKINIILCKPKGYISSDIDEGGYPSYRTLLQDSPYVNILHVAGRLDQDAEGLLIVSNDGKFIHEVISPKKKCEKEYVVYLQYEITPTQIDQLQSGVVLDDGYHTMPAKVNKIDHDKINIIIYEGKYHQIKRMLESVGNNVTYLKRLRIGNITLGDLGMGERRYL